MISFLCGLLLTGNCFAADDRPIIVGSKNFTEGVVLGEIIRALAASTGATVVQRQALGGTRLVFNALVSGEIDIYASVDSVHPGWSSLEISKKQPKKVILLGK